MRSGYVLCLRDQGKPVTENSLTDRGKFYILTLKEVTPMNKTDFWSVVKLLVTPVILVILGLALLLSPDSATSLLVRILGWILISVSAGLAFWALSVPGGLVSKVIGAVIFGLAGIWMVSHPLHLAAWVGRLVGLLLMIQGIQDIVYIRLRRSSVFLPVLTAVAGAVLVVLPMTTSRLVFRGMGAVILVIGVVMLIDRIRNRNRFRGPEDPNIIDAL